MTPSPWLQFLGGRSFVLCLGCNAVTSFLLWHNKLTDSSYLAITISTVGAFIGSMALQNRTQVRADVDKAVAGVQTDSQQQEQQQ